MRVGLLTLIFVVLSEVGISQVSTSQSHQPDLGHRSVSLLVVDGLQFKDLDRNGKLDPYEDWRLTSAVRAADLAARLSLQELAGLMVHGTLQSSGPMGLIGLGKAYDLVKTREIFDEKHVNS